MQPSRRKFLQFASAVSLGFSGLRLWAKPLPKQPPALGGKYGHLQPDPFKIIDLPKGFRYKIISQAGQEMADGLLVPHFPDGMATFRGPEGKTLLIRNHEIKESHNTNHGAFGEKMERLSRIDQRFLYDKGKGKHPALGGCTTLLYDTKQQRLLGQYLSLGGTLQNCAGGKTPWNTWLSCEENVQTQDASWEKNHGYVFEVPARWEKKLYQPIPLQTMGRMNHEACCVDPSTGIVYMTEDRFDSLIYRFLPHKKGHLAQGGVLQALALKKQKQADSRNWTQSSFIPNHSHEVEWISLPGVDSEKDDLRLRGFAKGATLFARGEGMWFGKNTVFFACTNGGKQKMGQIWKYRPSPQEGTPEEKKHPGKLELFIEADQNNLIRNADNLTIAPWGDLIVCEDGEAPQKLVGITPTGKVYTLAQNSYFSSEFAGATFSPDGTTLFVNLQGKGLTLAITGNW